REERVEELRLRTLREEVVRDDDQRPRPAYALDLPHRAHRIRQSRHREEHHRLVKTSIRKGQALGIHFKERRDAREAPEAGAPRRLLQHLARDIDTGYAHVGWI